MSPLQGFHQRILGGVHGHADQRESLILGGGKRRRGKRSWQRPPRRRFAVAARRRIIGGKESLKKARRRLIFSAIRLSQRKAAGDGAVIDVRRVEEIFLRQVLVAVRYGLVSLRETVGKFVLCALQIGSGASLGLEGPTVQICAGVSSLLAGAARLSPQNRRRMTSVGMAAGIAAAFNAPIAAITFTIEELVGDLDQTMLTGVIVAAALAAVVEHSVLGSNPVFRVPRPYLLLKASSLVWYALLGVLAAVVSVAFTDSLLYLRAKFKDFKSIPRWAHPALGGLGTGALAVLGFALFHTNGIAGDPYKTLTQALTGTLPLVLMAAFCVLKLGATVLSYSSGGSGGIFAPSLFMGGMLGGAVGYIDVTVFHHSTDAIGAFAVVGMGAVFAGIVRAPMTSILIVFEMTGGYGLVLPLMIANMTAFALARYWRKVPVYEALLAQDGIHLPHGPAPLGPPTQPTSIAENLAAGATEDATA